MGLTLDTRGASAANGTTLRPEGGKERGRELGWN